jgi:hypothetical protein
LRAKALMAPPVMGALAGEIACAANSLGQSGY